LPKDEGVFGKHRVIGECVVNQPGAFWRRGIMERAGLLDESLVYALDYEYWIRLALAGAQFIHIPETVALFRLSSESKTMTRSAQMAEEQLNVLERILSQTGLAEQLDMSVSELRSQERRARAVLCLHAFYGHAKARQWSLARMWFMKVIRADPIVIVQRRWLNLALAGLARRLKHT
jgi:hypothetical protein